MTPVSLRPGRWLLRVAGWPSWTWGTWHAGQGRDVFDGTTTANACLFFTLLLPFFPALFLLLTVDIARVAYTVAARRFIGAEAYTRFVANVRREPLVPRIFPWAVCGLLLLTPFVLWWTQHLRDLATRENASAWFLAIGYASLFGLVLLAADARASSKYRDSTAHR